MSFHSSSESGLIVAQARGLIRRGFAGALATLVKGSNHPYVSYVTLASDTDGSPVFLISELAWHTRNLNSDPRASVLFVSAVGESDLLAASRVSIIGIAERTDDPRISARFLARHPSAAQYAGFADFAFWRLRVDTFHFIGGFGRISTIAAEDALICAPVISYWNAHIDEAIESLNRLHAGRWHTLALRVGGVPEAGWALTACDPDGCDLSCSVASVRLGFERPITDPGELPDAIERLFEHYESEPET